MKREYIFGVLGLAVGIIGTWLFTMNITNQHDMGEMSMDTMVTELLPKSGGEFDEAFIQLMIEHHKGAIEMAKLMPSRAKHDELKKLGEDIIAAQTKEIQMMHDWAHLWGYHHDLPTKHDH